MLDICRTRRLQLGFRPQLVFRELQCSSPIKHQIIIETLLLAEAVCQEIGEFRLQTRSM